MEQAISFLAPGICLDSKVGFDALFLTYSDKEDVDALQFFGDLEKAIKKCQTLPDCLVIVANESLLEKLIGFWEKEIVLRESMEARGKVEGYSYIKSYYFYAWQAKTLDLKSTHPSTAQHYNIAVESLIKQGLKELIVKNQVVQIAPAGHTFKHLSGRKNKIFIQSREMAVSEKELRFISALIHLFNGELLSTCAIVYIDTMGIYQYIREALLISGNTPKIESFHSYDGLKKATPPSVPYMCFISASTSGGMVEELVSQGFDGSRITTLIDIVSTNRTGNVLIALDSIDKNYKNATTDGTETEIEIVGEHFTSKSKPPRPVNLGLPHRPKYLKKFLSKFALKDIEHLNYKPAATSQNSKLLFLNLVSLVDDLDFGVWLKEELTWCITSAINLIIFTDDEVSKKIAALAAERIRLIQEKKKPLTVISYKEISHEQLAKVKGVLVISGVAGDGSTLREISRDLREFLKPQIPRHYLVAVGLPQTEKAWEHLIQFLERNSTERKYGFSNWINLPIGYDGKDTAWSVLKKLAAVSGVAQPTNPNVTDAISNMSFDAVTKVIDTSHNGFLPKSNGKQLFLTEGFVFFDDLFKDQIKKVPTSSIYLTISSALQRAREIIDLKNQLKSTGYESVVLSPETFLRFNDNILQASLLRACHPSELDYSASSELSKLMKEFLAKVFARHEQKFGDAALEFAAALATKKLKIKDDDFNELLKTVIYQLKDTASPLLGFLLLAEQNNS